MCLIGIFGQGCREAANAGATLGPRAVVNAVSKASIFLGAADALMRLNIFHPPSVGRLLNAMLKALAEEGKA
jgi:hypothetical protein